MFEPDSEVRIFQARLVSKGVQKLTTGWVESLPLGRRTSYIEPLEINFPDRRFLSLLAAEISTFHQAGFAHMHEDDELMLRIQSGEADAYAELVQKYQPQLIGFFYRNVRDAQMAEDLSQDTMLRIYDQAWDYLPRGKFRGWMYRIGRNLMIDSIRRQSRDALVHAFKGTHEDEDDGLARIREEILSPQDQAHEKELTQLVDELLQQIPEEQRLTFTLHHYSQLSLPEVAEIMESTLPTTKSRLRLAREKLQAKLAERGINSPHVAPED